jgi:cyclic-di-AMP phosphodiesterase PgpH
MNLRTPNNLLDVTKAFAQTSRAQKLRIIVMGAVFVAHMLLISLTPQFGAFFSGFRSGDFSVGKPAPRDLHADKDITYVNEEATALRIEAVAALVSPVFVINENLSARSLQRFTDFSSLFAEARTRSSSAEKLFLEVQAAQPGIFSLERIDAILTVGNVLPNLNESRIALESILNRGVVAAVGDAIKPGTDTIEIIRELDGDSTRLSVPVESIVEIERLKESVEEELKARNVESKNHGVIVDIVSAFTEENAFFDADLTERRTERAIDEVNPVVGKLIRGERIAQSGMIVTEEDMKKIRAFAEYSTTVSVSRIIGSCLLVVLLYTLAIILISPFSAKTRLSDSRLFLVLGLSLLYTVLAVLLTRIDGLNLNVPTSVFLPSALIAMILTILVNQRVSVVIGLVLALSLLPLNDMDPFPTLFAFFAGIAGTVVVSGARKRLDLIRATVILALVSSGTMAVLSILKNLEVSGIFVSLGWGFLNGFACGILNLGLLPFLEHMMNAATHFRLMELSDLNSPIMNRMLSQAPGTYGHSVTVANLAESACRDIGANPLLARVGAYYHDIGKIDQAEYFVENQTDENKLNELKPSLSVAVIKSHVKIGVEKGKELGLPLEVLQIIAQHHGSGLISYFYAQALKNKGNKSISPKDYSYVGTPPVSKEAAVVMLADSVEAASRTMKKPSVAKLEKFIWNSIQDRIVAGQMSNCELTFRDLEMIKKSFVHILAGQFHARIEYPDIDESEPKKPEPSRAKG